jgi:hypothetical protein
MIVVGGDGVAVMHEVVTQMLVRFSVAVPNPPEDAAYQDRPVTSSQRAAWGSWGAALRMMSGSIAHTSSKPW